MEKYTMFMDWKNQYSENEYTTQSNLQIQHLILINLNLNVNIKSYLNQLFKQTDQNFKVEHNSIKKFRVW